jgi:hypothetical protein
MLFGNDQNFIGSGYRSLLLSDFAKNYTQLKINTQIWRFHYQNIFAEFTNFVPNQLKPYPNKYGAFHYLTYDVNSRINVGVMEAIMFYDNKHDGRQFEISYLNPIIFYRSAEQQLGSSDNSLLGANINIIPVRKLKLYGQLLLDEFRVHELLNQSGWWGNKYGIQAGLKWVDIFGLPNVDLQSEFNMVRPYTYSEDSTAKSYTQFSQPLAHPLGANFEELVNIISINPYGPLIIQFKYIYARQGIDSAGGLDWGGNPLISYNARPKQYNNEMLQGLLNTTQIAEVQATYQVRHNLMLDLSVLYRKENNSIYHDNTFYVGAGLRFNFPYKNYDF